MKTLITQCYETYAGAEEAEEAERRNAAAFGFKSGAHKIYPALVISFHLMLPYCHGKAASV